MIIRRLEDLAAIAEAKTPDDLWRHLIRYPTLRAERNDFEAIAVFRRLHGDGDSDAARTAALLFTDHRWRKAATTLIARIADSELVSPAELDDLADGFLWEDQYPWPVPRRWTRDGSVRAPARHGRRAVDVVVERPIAPPLRRWAAARITTSAPHRSTDVLERVTSLDAHSGDAVMTGLLDACRAWPDHARAAMIERGCAWSNGSVRLAALHLLADTDPEDAARRAAADPSAKVRDRAVRFQRLPIAMPAPDPSPQRSLFA